jgi:hypothetical protein
LKYPEEIEGVCLELAATDEQIKRRRARIRKLEQDVTLEACSAKDENGKPVLKNEREREAAIARLLSESTEYAEQAEELSGLEDDRIKLMARHQRLRDEFREELLDRQYRNDLAALKVADAIYSARFNAPPRDVEIVLPF